MKIPLIKNDVSVELQFDKVNEENLELKQAYYTIILDIEKSLLRSNDNTYTITKQHKIDFTYELLDSITALYNLYIKAKKDGLIIEDGWIEKMIRYEKDKGYEIERWVSVE